MKEPKALDLLRRGVPVVSMQGRGHKRTRAEELAQRNGWVIVYTPTKGVLIHVSDAANDDPRCKRARELGIATVSHDHWPLIAPYAEALKAKIGRLSKGGTAS